MITFALVGAGNRGHIYTDLISQSGKGRVTAVAEPNAERMREASERLGVAAESCFHTSDDMFARGKLADVCIITSLDRDHYAQAMRALELGYDLLLEKPISPLPEQCVAISDLARKTGRKVVVCHVLRYTPLFRAVKEIVDSGRFGKIVDIQHNENIGNFHMAHSFVRGNWRNLSVSSPIILQKTCHDMDLLTWFTGSRCKRVSSFGSLTYFKPENAPTGSAKRCAECPVAASCRFEARKCYLPVLGSWPASVVCEEQTEQALLSALQTGPYGRCVYACDNDVCDHQVTALEFENGVAATFNMSAFSSRICRTSKIMFEDGELRLNDLDNVIELTRFPSNAVDELRHEVIHPSLTAGGHGGGDFGLIEELLHRLEDTGDAPSSTIENSMESHLMAFAAEESRLSGQTVDMDAYRARLAQDTRKG